MRINESKEGIILFMVRGHAKMGVYARLGDRLFER